VSRAISVRHLTSPQRRLLTLLAPQVLVGELIAKQQGAAIVPPVHRYPDAQQLFPQQEVSYEQQPPLGQRSVRLGQPCRLNKPNNRGEIGETGKNAFAKGCPSGFSSLAEMSEDGAARTVMAKMRIPRHWLSCIMVHGQQEHLEELGCDCA
jgi:hypothetical protein